VNCARLKLALLEIAEGLRDELADGHLGDFVPPTMERRIEILGQKAWDALGNPSVKDAHDIRREGGSRQ
jgi:hypothetical protein